MLMWSKALRGQTEMLACTSRYDLARLHDLEPVPAIRRRARDRPDQHDGTEVRERDDVRATVPNEVSCQASQPTEMRCIQGPDQRDGVAEPHRCRSSRCGTEA